MTQDRSSRMSIAQGVPEDYGRQVEQRSGTYLPQHVKDDIRTVVEDESGSAFLRGVVVGIASAITFVFVFAVLRMIFNG